MLLGIDHIVVVVPELEGAVSQYQALGFTVVPGGKHPTGTHNALIGFEDGAYIELIAFYEPTPEHRWWQPLQQGGGLVDFCMQTDNLDADTTAFRQAGAALSDKSPLSRTRPDGYKLDWVLALPTNRTIPFLIEDITPRDERVPKQRTHPNAVVGIDRLTIVVHDLPAVERCYTSVLKTPGEHMERPNTAGGLRFRVGSHTLEFVEPAQDNPLLQQWIETRGEGLYGAALNTTGERKGPLDPTQSITSRLSLV